jgi:50S ribosomal protein L16 3-hydroxylase
MLRRWLAPQPLDEFLGSHFGRSPFARPAAAIDVLSWFDWSALDALVAARRPAPDVLVASSGRLVDMPAPRNLSEVRQVMCREHGVVVRKAERHDARLAELAQAMAVDLPGVVHVQIYATPAGTQTFGWHFDSEDVFIVQTAGAKDYYMRRNTVAPRSPEEYPDFETVRRETSPLVAARLLPGDWLYIPARWWHLVHSLEDSLSISIGVLHRPRSTNGASMAALRRPGEHVEVAREMEQRRADEA